MGLLNAFHKRFEGFLTNEVLLLFINYIIYIILILLIEIVSDTP